MMKKQILAKMFFVLFLLCILFFTISSICYGADPKLITNINKAFQNIKEWCIKLATPAAAVAVATGIFIKKFSFGDEERIQTGKKIIRTSLFSYVFIISIDLILTTINSLATGK